MTIPENVYVKSAKYVGDYRITFRFTDGHATEIDFHDFLSAPAQNPMATQYLDVTRFKKFAIEDRADIVWGDWEMCFPFAALYAGDLGVDSLGNKLKAPSRSVAGKGVRSKEKAARPVRATSRAKRTVKTLKSK